MLQKGSFRGQRGEGHSNTTVVILKNEDGAQRSSSYSLKLSLCLLGKGLLLMLFWAFNTTATPLSSLFILFIKIHVCCAKFHRFLMKVHSVEIRIALRIGSIWQRDVDKCFGIWSSQCNICSYTESHPTCFFTGHIDEEEISGEREGGVCLVTCFLSCIDCFYQIYPCYSSCLDHTKGEICFYRKNKRNILWEYFVLGPLSGVGQWCWSSQIFISLLNLN